MRTMLDAMDDGRLRPRYWFLFALLVFNTIVEFFDFFIIGFLISVIGPQWDLTIGQTSLILIGGGVGQLAGSIPMAWLADRFGRRPILLLGTCFYAGAAGMIALIPDGSWELLIVLRLIVGIGYSAVVSTQLALLLEFSPTRLRTVIAGSSGAFAPIGVMLASASIGYLLPMLGWRWLAAMGALPILLAAILYFVLPESARWLVAKGRPEEARATLDRFVDMPDEPLDMQPLPPRKPVSILALYSDPKRFWLILCLAAGLGMGGHAALAWGPTFLSLLLRISPVEAARWFAWIGIAGVAGRVVFTFLPAVIGRWKSALLCCWASAVLLTVAGAFPTAMIGPVSVFFCCLLLGAMFYDGGFTNILPYAGELFPVQQAAQGIALGHTASGLAKLAGPLLVGLVAGSQKALTHDAALAAAFPAFAMLAAFAVLAGLVMLAVRVETHNRKMKLELD